MFWLRLAPKSILCGIVVTFHLTLVSLLIGNKTVTQFLLSPLALVMHLMGPPPLLGYDERGKPLYEGTPVDGFIFVIGMFLCVVFYSLISFLTFIILNKSRKTGALK